MASMSHISPVLIANRGEIAVRLIKSAKALGIKTIAIYTPVDQQSLHVRLADKAVPLTGGNAGGYLQTAEILEICQAENVASVIPGYGFLSENTDFAEDVVKAGMTWIGPSSDTIKSFGIKHTSRILAEEAGVPIVPGTKDLLKNAQEARQAAEAIGFPVILKATAGGGGMGLQVCNNSDEVQHYFETIVSRGQTLFKNAGVFMEKYIAQGRHIEVQIFGNGLGDAISFFERECSIQRRHQKVIEECPSLFVGKTPGLRQKLSDAAIRLAELVKYKSAGTVEFLVDDDTGSFFFLEMNTRLQVEHGITELCYNVDLVAMMYEQAAAEASPLGGIKHLKQRQPTGPQGAAVELRLYAENPVRNYAPSPGLLQDLEWAKGDIRIDTWVTKGTNISAYYDPLLAKLMAHSPTREESSEKLIRFIDDSVIAGPPTNADFLRQILASPPFKAGQTTTNFLSTKFNYKPCAIDVISGGPLTHIQDLPAWFGVRNGVPESGPMDPLAFQIANILVGNELTTEALEMTGAGPELRFLADALIAVSGPDIAIELDGEPKKSWESFAVKAGQRLSLGKIRGNGCRAYLAISGGFPSVPKFIGSKSNAIACNFGGYQGRRLAAGDLIFLKEQDVSRLSQFTRAFPSDLLPKYESDWEIYCVPGPHDVGFLTNSGIETLYNTKWKVSHNASRSGIAIVGPTPEFSRQDGGEGGGHPSNVLEYGYPLGAVNWAGDAANILPLEGPDMGGFISTNTVVRADFWRLGQVSPGNTVTFKPISFDSAIELRKRTIDFISTTSEAFKRPGGIKDLRPLDWVVPSDHVSAVIKEIHETDSRPPTTYRQAGDTYILVEYGQQKSSLNLRGRVELLANEIESWKDDRISGCVATHINLLVQFEGTRLHQSELMEKLIKAEQRIPDASQAKLPSRIIRLPLVWDDSVTKKYIQDYTEAVRSSAVYLPSNIDFVARNNGITAQDVLDTFIKARWICVSVCFYTAVPCIINLDPRKQLRCPKWNPPRTATPEGCVGVGGISACIYNSLSPGGFQMMGRSIPGWDFFSLNKQYLRNKPAFFRTFDQFEFYQVSEEEYNKFLDDFHAGQFTYDIQPAEFDMKEYNEFLDSIQDDLVQVRKRQDEAAAVLAKEEASLLAEWKASKAAMVTFVTDDIEKLKADPKLSYIASPMNANVWKLQVKEGDIIQKNHLITILEAMKMEISVFSEDEFIGTRVTKVVQKPGSIVSPGDPICFVEEVQ
ncbi:hypothetical protein H0G86_007049 [Trichoderma simmonsii]|uniref:Urea carboxylase n=1 Tax=Trichoderma simmonsii TaxID=1491479 RepID=A0A8G0PEP2_9HYPO|nr:hypothetical protein H0G86_007049 [Trichoderma simmonsii]